MSSIVVDIDRIVLTDLNMTPDRAERIRAMVEVELQRLMEREGLLDDILSGEAGASYMTAPMLQISEEHSDSRMASSLAHRIAKTLHSVVI